MSIATRMLSFTYARDPVLEGLSVEAGPGRITAVLGPNAAGKSTLLRCLIGSLRPGVGEVLLDGRPAHRWRPRALAARVAYVPQRSVVAAAFTARDVVELGRYALDPDRGRVEEALSRLDLAHLADRRFSELSVGQQQRVVLARALAQVAGNGHLVLDEPMSAMDLRHVRDSLGLLRQLADGGVTVIMAMHDVTLAARVADDAWLLDGGRLAAAGPVAEVLTVDRLQDVYRVPFTAVPDRDGHTSPVAVMHLEDQHG